MKNAQADEWLLYKYFIFSENLNTKKDKNWFKW